MHYDRYPHTRSYTRGDAFPEHTHGGKTIGDEPRVDKVLQICKLARRVLYV